MVYSPGDNDLVKFIDEDGWNNAFVPLFIEAFKDQQVIIDKQNQKIDTYEKELESTRLM